VDAGPGSLIHQTNGFQTVRAVFALSVLTGCYDRPGGNFPSETGFCEMPCGYAAEDETFAMETAPADYGERVGARRFPVWGRLIHQAQYTDLARQILEGTPYPLKSLVSFGMNYRMFPESKTMKRALLSLDFFVDVDLFLTDTAVLADIVLPCVSSLEREEFKAYPGGYAAWYRPVIAPVGEGRSDARIIQELAIRLELDDAYLRGGYRKCVEYALRRTGIDLDALAGSELPLKVPPACMTKREPLGYVNSGCRTKSGKLELWSELVAECGNGLDPLPRWTPVSPEPDADCAASPARCAGGAFTGSLHSNTFSRRIRNFGRKIISG